MCVYVCVCVCVFMCVCLQNEAAAPADSATTQETKKQLNELRKATQEREQFLVDISNECSNMEALVKRNQKMTGALNEVRRTCALGRCACVQLRVALS